ncbi:hypothetical protein AX16_010750 [Volvariella volvacea WC 439]|nr:hypothetical protein AX16_010750 [Volvariella volvacea WC 439]
MSQNYCRHFAKSGACKFGAKCRYPHIQVEGFEEVESPAVAASKPRKHLRTKRGKKKREQASADTAEKEQPQGTETQEPNAPASPAQNPIDEFFAEYAEFDYNRSRPVASEFTRMTRHYKWEKRTEEFQAVNKAYRLALTDHFNSFFGTDARDLGNWQNLCRIIGITPIPDDVKMCKLAIKSSYINLVDLSEFSRTGRPVTRFKSEWELASYTIAKHKTFPREEARAGGLLKYLLRHITSPRSRPGYRRHPRRPKAPATQSGPSAPPATAAPAPTQAQN